MGGGDELREGTGEHQRSMGIRAEFNYLHGFAINESGIDRAE